MRQGGGGRRAERPSIELATTIARNVKDSFKEDGFSTVSVAV